MIQCKFCESDMIECYQHGDDIKYFCKCGATAIHCQMTEHIIYNKSVWEENKFKVKKIVVSDGEVIFSE